MVLDALAAVVHEQYEDGRAEGAGVLADMVLRDTSMPPLRAFAITLAAVEMIVPADSSVDLDLRDWVFDEFHRVPWPEAASA